jgi:NADH:ubiquinone oxidoreductase subunit F (NADH-binding)
VTAHPAAPAWAGQPPAPGDLRLITSDLPPSLAEHINRYGPPPAAGRHSAMLITEVERAGLTGRGGGAFPAGRKMRAVAAASLRSGKLRARSSSVVVANGSESEPASSKDEVLLSHSPHLVLDGIAVSAAAVGADRAYLCVGAHSPAAARAVAAALAERDRAGIDAVPVTMTGTEDGYLSGQETALINALNGGAALPAFVPPRPAERGAHRRPTLVQNVETFAHIALIARFGAEWFREVGTARAPGSALVTVTGSVARPGVREIPLGTPLGEVLRRSGQLAGAQAVLTGGYFGTWLPLPAAAQVAVSEDGMRAAGAALGPGVLAVLPDSACGLAETARVLGFLADQSARQCGPCRNGMPALADAMRRIAFGPPSRDAVGWVEQLSGLVTGRGACHLPDGGAALARTALKVFAADLRAHLASGPCHRASRPAVLPIPNGQDR